LTDKHKSARGAELINSLSAFDRRQNSSTPLITLIGLLECFYFAEKAVAICAPGDFSLRAHYSPEALQLTNDDVKLVHSSAAVAFLNWKRAF
jgi:hypothetical protein